MTGLKVCVAILTAITVFMAGLTITCIGISGKKITQKNRKIRQLSHQLNSKKNLITDIGDTQQNLLADLVETSNQLDMAHRECADLRAENNRLRVRLEIYRKGQRKEATDEIQSVS